MSQPKYPPLVAKALEEYGLQVSEDGNQLIVPASFWDKKPGATVAKPPTWQAQELAQVRDYESVTRIKSVEATAIASIDAVKAAHDHITAMGDELHPALTNELRGLEVQTYETVKSIIARFGYG